MVTVIKVNADSKIAADPAYQEVTIETDGQSYRLDFPQTSGEDLALACDTLIAAIERVREMAPASVRR